MVWIGLGGKEVTKGIPLLRFRLFSSGVLLLLSFTRVHLDLETLLRQRTGATLSGKSWSGLVGREVLLLRTSRVHLSMVVELECELVGVKRYRVRRGARYKVPAVSALLKHTPSQNP